MEIAWIAALIPKRLKRADEDAVDLVNLKEEISRFPAPLRQSAIYLLGICRLLCRRVEYLESSYFHVEEAEEVSASVSKPKKRHAPQAIAVIDEALPPPPTPMSLRSAVTPQQLPDEFGADFTPDFDGSEASIRKRPRLSLLSDVLDDLRGEDFDRMEDQMHAHPRDSEASRPDFDFTGGRKQSRRTQLSRRVLKEFKEQSGKSRDPEFGIRLSPSACFLPINCKVIETGEPEDNVDTECFTGPVEDEWVGEPEYVDENVNYHNEPTACLQVQPGLTVNFSGLVKSNKRVEAVRLFAELLQLKCRGEVDLENARPGEFGELRISNLSNWQY